MKFTEETLKKIVKNDLKKEDYLRGGLSGDFKGDFRGEPFRIELEDVNLRLNGTFGADE